MEQTGLKPTSCNTNRLLAIVFTALFLLLASAIFAKADHGPGVIQRIDPKDPEILQMRIPWKFGMIPGHVVVKYGDLLLAYLVIDVKRVAPCHNDCPTAAYVFPEKRLLFFDYKSNLVYHAHELPDFIKEAGDGEWTWFYRSASDHMELHPNPNER